MAQDYKPYVLPYEQMKETLLLRQERYEKEQEIERKKSLEMMEQIKSYYSSFKTYPQKITNGWHSAIAMNNYDFCEPVKVFVENNKIIKYVTNNWYYHEISSGGYINDCKSMINILDGNGKNEYFNLYLIDYIENQNSKTSSPTVGGHISFWSDLKSGGNIKIYMQGVYIGELNSYFYEMPDCGDDGTLSITYKPGIYSYRATNNKYTWSGTFTIEPDNCFLINLGK